MVWVSKVCLSYIQSQQRVECGSLEKLKRLIGKISKKIDDVISLGIGGFLYSRVQVFLGMRDINETASDLLHR